MHSPGGVSRITAAGRTTRMDGPARVLHRTRLSLGRRPVSQAAQPPLRAVSFLPSRYSQESSVMTSLAAQIPVTMASQMFQPPL